MKYVTEAPSASLLGKEDDDKLSRVTPSEGREVVLSTCCRYRARTQTFCKRNVAGKVQRRCEDGGSVGFRRDARSCGAARSSARAACPGDQKHAKKLGMPARQFEFLVARVEHYERGQTLTRTTQSLLLSLVRQRGQPDSS